MIRVARLCIDSILLMCFFFFLAFTKLRSRLGQCCVKLHYGIVLGAYWLLRSCAGNWIGVAPNQHQGIVVGMLPQRLSLKHNPQMAKTERSEKGTLNIHHLRKYVPRVTNINFHQTFTCINNKEKTFMGIGKLSPR